MGKLKGIIVILIVSLLILGAAFPYIKWERSQVKELNVFILDKTVPDNSYREHRRLIYALNHYKYQKKDSTEYNLEDYSGFYPLEDEKYKTSNVKDDLKENTDLIYIADSYGVYEEEFFKNKIEGERSEIIYGGLKSEEIEVIKEQVYENNIPLVAEFNTFGSPTDTAARKEIEEILGVKWSGWIGRYFNELDYEKNEEVPAWIIRAYEGGEDESWAFKGSGFILASDQDEIIVLEAKDFKGKGIAIDFTDKGREFFETDKTSAYGYWFDIVETREAEAYAWYKWDLTKEGEEKISARGIPKIFPSITRRTVNTTPIYYFAGDFADTSRDRGFYKYEGLSKIMGAVSKFNGDNDTKFQWRIYYPVMKNILEEAYSLNTN
nr:hypothetical protein [Tissierella sp.]